MDVMPSVALLTIGLPAGCVISGSSTSKFVCGQSILIACTLAGVAIKYSPSRRKPSNLVG